MKIGSFRAHFIVHDRVRNTLQVKLPKLVSERKKKRKKGKKRRRSPSGKRKRRKEKKKHCHST